MIRIPSFAETNHPLIQTLHYYSDADLLACCQSAPGQGKYFTGIFCRYGELIYNSISGVERSPVETNFLFALTWRDIFHGIHQVDPKVQPLEPWLLNKATASQASYQLPPLAEISYNIEVVSPPLWCYIGQSLEQLPPLLRLTILLSDYFHWTSAEICEYLEQNGDVVNLVNVEEWIAHGRSQLHNGLPADIRTIYFGEPLPTLTAATEQPEVTNG